MTETHSSYVHFRTGESYGEDYRKVGIITLTRPPLNALNRQMQKELSNAVDQAQEDPSVRAVIVYGGEKVFAAGADVKEMNELSFTQISDIVGQLQDNLGSISRLTKPTVAAITGYALGGGLEVALGADYRIAGDNAKLGFPEISLGIIPGGGGTQRLARLIGPAKAKDLIFTGRYVSAQEALELGIVDKVVPPDNVLHEALLWTSKFTRGPIRALAAAKAAIDDGLDVCLSQGLKLEQRLFAELFATTDRTIGMTSFIEKGPGKAEFSEE